jgi:deoxyribose-phosphate aldolase
LIWEKIATLDNQFQADQLTDALRKEAIPFLLREYKDSAYDGLFATQKGWGTIMVDDSRLEEAEEILKDLFNSGPGGTRHVGSDWP